MDHLSQGAKLTLRQLGIMLALFGAYFLAARLGLRIDPVGRFATFVWPPTGIAIAAILIFGRRVWPGVFLGAFVVNWSVGSSAPVALAIGIGNTLEALTASYLLGRFDFRSSLDRVRDVLQLVVLGALLSTIVSATIGVSSLLWSGVIAAADYAKTWQAWWVGDALGALVVAPLLLVLFRRRSGTRSPSHPAEALLLGIVLLAINAYVFIGSSASSAPYTLAPTSYLLLLPLFWAALRFGQAATVTSIFFTSAVAVWATISGAGPFAGLQAELSLLHLQLFVAVGATTSMILAAAVSELEQARLQLSLANKRKDEFIAVLGHELRNPLAVISTSVEVAEIQGPSKDFLSTVRQQLGHVGRLLEDLLDASRISHGKINLRPEVMDARRAATLAVESTRPMMEARRQELSVSLPREPLMLKADPVRLGQMIINLLNNAAKYTDPGGRIWLALRREKDMVAIEVRDSGIGIPDHALDRIFQPFSQLDKSLFRSQGGLGLGLSVVKKLVELHGGRISVQSDGPSKGARFTLYIPTWREES